MKLKKVFNTMFYILTFTSVSGQNIEFIKANFKDNLKEFKLANYKIQEGDALFQQRKYEEALNSYFVANDFNSNSATLNAKIGAVYLMTATKHLAHSYLQNAVSLNSKIDSYYRFLLGRSYHFGNEFDEAIKNYEMAKHTPSKIKSLSTNEIKKRIEECKNGKKLINGTVEVKIDLVSTEINTVNQEYVPLINADETVMFFTSRRQENLGGEKDFLINDYYEDIYMSTREGDTWGKAINIGAPVNSDRHDATVGLSVDGQTLFLYRDNEKNNGDIYLSKLHGSTWSDPVPLPEPINSDAQETSACFSPDEHTIYFVSDRPGGKGGKDIYFSTKSKSGEWREAIPISTINTPEEEDAVFLHPDGKTLYFSSKGFNTMGGYDIFKSEFKDGKWANPVNVGYPINSSGDDVSIVLSANAKHGYYTSAREGGTGKRDIYRIEFLEQNDMPHITLLKGIITDRNTGKPLEAEIELYDNTNDEQVAVFHSNEETGKYLISIPAGVNYGLYVKLKDYMFHSEVFHVDSSHAYEEIEKNVELLSLEVGTKIILNNVFYDYGKATLSYASHHELDVVVELLKQNSNLKIELSSHTDARGSADFNQDLSKERAQSCVDYLLEKGINNDRLVAKGYGETKLLYSNEQINAYESEEEREHMHQQNRRTEFKIIK